MLKEFVTFVMVYLFWILLTFSTGYEELLLGAAVSLAVTYVSRKFSQTRDRALHPLRWVNAAVYILVFLREEVRCHLDVAYRVITGRINPAIVKARLDMDTEIGRAMVANSITLTPGTLAVSIGGKNLFVHCLSYSEGKDVSQPFGRLATRVFEHRSKWK